MRLTSDLRQEAQQIDSARSDARIGRERDDRNAARARGLRRRLHRLGEERAEDDLGAFGDRLLGGDLRRRRSAGIVLHQKLDVGRIEFGKRKLGGVAASTAPRRPALPGADSGRINATLTWPVPIAARPEPAVRPEPARRIVDRDCAPRRPPERQWPSPAQADETSPSPCDRSYKHRKVRDMDFLKNATRGRRTVHDCNLAYCRRMVNQAKSLGFCGAVCRWRETERSGATSLQAAKVSAPALPRRPLSGRDPDRKSARHHPARARNARRRRCDCLRGHPRHPQAARPLRHHDAAHALSRAQCRRGAAEAVSAACRRRRGRARLRCRHAADFRSRLQAGARRRAGGSCGTAVAGRVVGAGRPGGAGLPTDRFFFEGFLPPKAAQRRTRHRGTVAHSGDARVL